MSHRNFTSGRTFDERKSSQASALHGIRGQQSGEEKEPSKSFFPLFVNLDGKKAAVVGGGAVAVRRARTLIKFGAAVRFIARDISGEAACLVRDGKATWVGIEFTPSLLEGSDIVVAASENRATNRAVSEAAKKMQILVNVVDSRNESTYMFPAVAQSDKFVAGIITNSNDYDAAIRMVQKLCEKMKNIKI